MKYNRPIVLSIAGFDPTGGAGVLSDAKTFEQHGCLGMAVLTANTNQTESDFLSVNWIEKEEIIKQLSPIVSNYEISAVKIGIVENLDTLLAILLEIKKVIPAIPIVWDPVLAASSGFELHTNWNREMLKEILNYINLITPNVLEIRRLTEIEDEIDGAIELSKYTTVLLKGGHSNKQLGVDVLVEEGIPREIQPKLIPENCFPKHGSGCILSAAIAAALAHGKTITEACEMGKIYTEKRLSSNKQLLAYHVE